METCQFQEAEIVGIEFGLTTYGDIRTACISDCSISHFNQIANPFLGLPLEHGRCESCGTSEPEKCEGHFGYIELPVPIYHPCHVKELRHMLSLLCLKCLRMRKKKLRRPNNATFDEVTFTCCKETAKISINEIQKAENVVFLELKVQDREEPSWTFMERYGFRYGENQTRTILPFEVMQMLKLIPEDVRKMLYGKGYFPQEGYILSFLPVPPNCLLMPNFFDGTASVSSNLAISFLKKIITQVQIIRGAHSGPSNFESHEVEAIGLQFAVQRYLEARGLSKTVRDSSTRFGIRKISNEASTKLWGDKMRSLFVSKGCGFSSRGVITGDAFRGVNEIGIPRDIAEKISYEERVNVHNSSYLQKLVDDKECIKYHDGLSTFSLGEGSKGRTSLQLGQVVHRRIRDGDMVFINRPPTIHKHSLQALRVYIHDDHTIKINPLVCSPLSADFDGDCINLFYPQSIVAKAEALELFSLENQLFSSHSGNFLLHLGTDSLLSMKRLCNEKILPREMAEALLMCVSCSSLQANLFDAKAVRQSFTPLQILQTCLPHNLDICSETSSIQKSNIKSLDVRRNIQSTFNEMAASIFSLQGPSATILFLNSLQPLLMEYIFSHGFSFGLKELYLPLSVQSTVLDTLDALSSFLRNLRSDCNKRVKLLVENQYRYAKAYVADLISQSSILSDLIDLKNQSELSKFIQLIGFLGLQITHGGKFHSQILSDEMAAHFERVHPNSDNYCAAKHGLIKGCFVHGLDPYETMIHTIAVRETILRASVGLSEPGSLFKNLMAMLRDVVMSYDGTVRNGSSNSIIQFQYAINTGNSNSVLPAGEPVGVLAATAVSSLSYKAVLDSSSTGSPSWERIKEVLCGGNSKKGDADHRVVLYLNDCRCKGRHCSEKTAYIVKNHLEKIILEEFTDSLSIDYGRRGLSVESGFVGLCGHVRLNKRMMEQYNLDMNIIIQKCNKGLSSFCRRKKVGDIFKMVALSNCHSCFEDDTGKHREFHCMMVWLKSMHELPLEKISDILSGLVFPLLRKTTVKGDDRISSVNIARIDPETALWVRHPLGEHQTEFVVELVLENKAVIKDGDVWRVALDCCLPILPLIDTTRSIPTAMKQVHKFFGVCCAFDYAAQQLATSVTSVAKGVLKEHLILVSSNMTFTGNTVGFSPRGYKALSRSCNIQAPFTEAILLTPKTCFERAAVKRHVDKLSSVVAACSWGKLVGVGTGSTFDIILNNREIPLIRECDSDPYECLSRASSGNDSVKINDWNPSSQSNGKEHLWVKYTGLSAETNAETIDKTDAWNSVPQSNTGDQPWVQSSCLNAENNAETIDKTDAWNPSNQSNMDEHPWVKSSCLSARDNAEMIGKNDAWNSSSHSNMDKQPWVQSSCLSAQDNGEMIDKNDAWNSSNQSNMDERPWVQSSCLSAQDNAEMIDKNDAWNASNQSNMDERPWVQSSCLSAQDNAEMIDKTDAWNSSQSNMGEQPWIQSSCLSDEDNPIGTHQTDGWDLSTQNNMVEPSWVKSGSGTEENDKMTRNSDSWNPSTQNNVEGNPWPPSSRKHSNVNSSSDWTPRGGKKKGKTAECNRRNRPSRSSVYTAEERVIVSDVNPMFQTIQQIMSRYSNGDRLSETDQSYMVENILNYHPNTADKTGVGIDHLLVNKHSIFTDTRCFHIVSTDGQIQDFSYIKCIKEFVKSKYPDLAAQFISKHPLLRH